MWGTFCAFARWVKDSLVSLCRNVWERVKWVFGRLREGVVWVYRRLRRWDSRPRSNTPSRMLLWLRRFAGVEPLLPRVHRI